MKNIPADGIYYEDALIIVFQKLTPHWQALEERLNPSSQYYDAFPERDARDRAYEQAYRTYDKGMLLAHEWLQEKRSQGILLAMTRNPKTGEPDQLHRDRDIDRYAPESSGQPVYFVRKPFVMKDIAHPDAMKTFALQQTGQTRPAERKLEPKVWLAWALKEHPEQQNERSTPYIRHLHGLMQEADNVTYAWKYETFRIRYYEAVKAERQAVQKKRKSQRTV
jgi:hypothetical protein